MLTIHSVRVAVRGGVVNSEAIAELPRAVLAHPATSPRRLPQHRQAAGAGGGESREAFFDFPFDQILLLATASALNFIASSPLLGGYNGAFFNVDGTIVMALIRSLTASAYLAFGCL